MKSKVVKLEVGTFAAGKITRVDLVEILTILGNLKLISGRINANDCSLNYFNRLSGTILGVM